MSRSRSSKLVFVRVYMRTRLRYRTQIGWVPLVSAVHIRRASACCQRGGFASLVFASLSFSVRCQQGVSKSSVHDVRPPSTATSPMPLLAACAADQARAGHRETVQVVMLTPRTSNLPTFCGVCGWRCEQKWRHGKTVVFCTGVCWPGEGREVIAVSTFAFRCDTGYGFSRLAKPQACTADTG